MNLSRKDCAPAIGGEITHAKRSATKKPAWRQDQNMALTSTFSWRDIGCIKQIFSLDVVSLAFGLVF